MYGAWAAKDFILQYLQADLPSRLAKYRDTWGLDDTILGEARKMLSYEPAAIDSWPTINVVAVSMSGLTRIDYDNALNPEYRVNYQMRVYIWTKGDNSELATRSRDALTAVVREALLDHPCLVAADTDNREVKLEEDTLREEYSELTPVKGDRMMAAAYLGFTLGLNERVERSTLGTIGEFDVLSARML